MRSRGGEGGTKRRRTRRRLKERGKRERRQQLSSLEYGKPKQLYEASEQTWSKHCAFYVHEKTFPSSIKSMCVNF